MENVEQGTPEWFAARCGKVTASRIADVMTKTRNGYGAGRANYMAQLIAERLTGNVADSYTNTAMQHGIDTEPMAREAYELDRYVSVEHVGFVDHPSIEMAGASPDGRVADDGNVEIKCPNTATHIETLLGAPIDGKYIKQMTWQMVCDDRQWCDFVSFDPRMPEELQLFVKRVDLDTYLALTITKEVEKFLAELDEKEKKLRALI